MPIKSCYHEEDLGEIVVGIEPRGVRSEGVGYFFKAVTQVLLFFMAETWVLTTRMERALVNFQHRVARRITGRQPKRQGDKSW